MISIQVPARICFFGDHQDYLGLPVIAGSINRFIHLTAEPIEEKEFQLDLKDIQTQRILPFTVSKDSIAPSDFLRAALKLVQGKGLHFNQGYKVAISGNIPVNAGVSSSSALTVAWLRFLVKIQDSPIIVSDKEIGHWAYETEVLFFKNPGGLMDQYTIAQQGLLFIDTDSGKTERLIGNLGTLVVAESGISKKTLEVLQNARTYQEKGVEAVRQKNPEFNLKNASVTEYTQYLRDIPERYQPYWYATIHNYYITQEAKKELQVQQPNLEKLGNLMNQHQTILENQIRNTPEAMKVMLNAARQAGALGAKIIGSGGGGCMLAMVTSSTKDNVIEAFFAHGAKDAYEVTLTYP